MSTCPHRELQHTCYICDLEVERNRLRAVVDELLRAAEGPVGDGNPDDDSYVEGNNAAWAYVLRCIEEGT